MGRGVRAGGPGSPKLLCRMPQSLAESGRAAVAGSGLMARGMWRNMARVRQAFLVDDVDTQAQYGRTEGVLYPPDVAALLQARGARDVPARDALMLLIYSDPSHYALGLSGVERKRS